MFVALQLLPAKENITKSNKICWSTPTEVV